MTSEPTLGADPRRSPITPGVPTRIADAVTARGSASVLVGFGIVVVGSLLLEVGRLNTWDEAWFLQVATRLSNGEALYRDVFFGTTPLAAYLGAGLVALFGSELVVLKVAGIACVAATYLLVVSIAGRLRIPISPVVWGAAVFVTELPYTFGYSMLATTLLLAAFAAFLAWHEPMSRGRSPETRWLVLAGLLAGASVATKHNTGALGAIALAIALVVALRSHRLLTVRRTATSFAALGVPILGVPLALAVPVMVSGGIAAAIDYTIGSKLAYVEIGALSYWTGLEQSIGSLLPDGQVTVRTMLQGLQAGRPYVFLLPPLTAAVAILAWVRLRPASRGVGAPLALFAAAAAISIYPRADQSHFTVIAPILLLAIAYFGWASLNRTAGSVLALGVMALAGVLLVSGPLLWIRTGSQPATASHMRGVVLAPGHETQLSALALELRRATNGQPTFYLLPEAGLYYLLTGTSNPTPYDFPLRTAFGTDGVGRVEEQIGRGEIAYVCIHPTWGLEGPLPGPFPELQPIELAAFVRERMVHVRALALCDLYRSEAARPAS